MTAASPPTQAGPAAELPPAAGTGIWRLLAAEWTKIRSVRSTLWTLILLVVVTVGFTSLLTLAISASWDRSRPGEHATIVADPVGAILGTGITFGQLTICVLGVLVISSEYSSGAIRASLLAVPRRWPMLAAKAVVFGVIVFVVVRSWPRSARSSPGQRSCTATRPCRWATQGSCGRCSGPGSMSSCSAGSRWRSAGCCATPLAPLRPPSGWSSSCRSSAASCPGAGVITSTPTCPSVAGSMICPGTPGSGPGADAMAGVRRVLHLDGGGAGRRVLPPPAPRRLIPARRGQETQAGPSSCFRSATRRRRRLHPQLVVELDHGRARRPLHSRRCTSARPGWVRSTSCSRSTTGGDAPLAPGSTRRKGRTRPATGPARSPPSRPAWATSSRRSSRPLTTTMASSASRCAHGW